MLSAGVFFAFSLFPGGNFILALAIDIPLVLAFAYSYGLLASMLPRTGGDYMFVTRVLHPAVGVISSTCWMVSLFLSNAFFATAFIKVGLAPGFSIIGLLAKSPTWVSWGHTLATNTTSEFVVGTIMFLLAAGMMAAGWRLTLRLQAIVFGITVVGIVLCGLIALFTSRGAFIHNFNHFAAPYTHQGNTYGATIATAAKSGVVVNPPFSIANTVPLLGVLAMRAPPGTLHADGERHGPRWDGGGRRDRHLRRDLPPHVRDGVRHGSQLSDGAPELHRRLTDVLLPALGVGRERGGGRHSGVHVRGLLAAQHVSSSRGHSTGCCRSRRPGSHAGTHQSSR